MLGIKLCAVSFQKLKDNDSFSSVVTELLNE
jgi:predicted CopG family antitoxin